MNGAVAKAEAVQDATVVLALYFATCAVSPAILLGNVLICLGLVFCDESCFPTSPSEEFSILPLVHR